MTEQGSIPVNRFHVKQIQTPQVFSAALIKNAYLQEYNPEATYEGEFYAGLDLALVEHGDEIRPERFGRVFILTTGHELIDDQKKAHHDQPDEHPAHRRLLATCFLACGFSGIHNFLIYAPLRRAPF